MTTHTNVTVNTFAELVKVVAGIKGSRHNVQEFSVCWAFREFSGVTTAVPTGLPSHTIGCTSLRQHGSASLGA